MKKNIFDLTGQVALVAGGSSGLGTQLAKALANAGADIALVARREDRMADNAKKITDLCNKYGAKAVSMNKYAYEKYFFEDAVHPWAKGWVYINEEIYKFYNQN